jgi:hypothetical protein
MTERLSILSELIKLARIDNELRDEEFNFLFAISKMLGIDKTAFERLFSEYIEYTPSKIETNRILQFYRMVLLINSDRNINSKELSFVKSAGLRLGLHTDAIESVLSEMKNNEKGIIPEDRLIEIFKTHYN